MLATCPARETLLTCVSELATNAIEHTASGRGGMFTVEVGRPREGVAFVAVADDGAATAPAVEAADDFAEGGRGLALVAAYSSRWGFRDGERGRTVWAEVTWPVPVGELRGVRK
ncbi:MAG: ATP-binding protein, partial [Trebonia sp.]